MPDNYERISPFHVREVGSDAFRLEVRASFDSVSMRSRNDLTYLTRPEAVALHGWLTAFLAETR